MTYRQLLTILTELQTKAPEYLDAEIAVVGGTDEPLNITHTEFNDGSITGHNPAWPLAKQLMLMTV